MFVTWHFSHPPSAAERLNDHLLFDCRQVLTQIQFPKDARPDRTKPVLTVAQTAAEPPIYARSDERTACQAQELVESAVQLA